MDRNIELLRNRLKYVESSVDNLEDYLFDNNSDSSDESIDYKISSLINQVQTLNKKVLALEKNKKQSDKILKSYNQLFNNILVFYDLSPKKLLKYSHELTEQMLIFIDNVCKKHNLQWWLDSGSLLGAVRHGGFIPFDDDVDINMIRKDYNEFLKVMPIEMKNNNVTDRMLIKTNSVVKKRVMPFTKVDFRMNKTTIAFLDIFPSDFMVDIDENKPKDLKKVRVKYRKILNKNRKKLPKILNKLSDELNLADEGKYVIRGFEDGIYGLKYYKTSTVFPLKEIPFDDKMFPCPNDCDDYLTSIYGEDYLSIPKVVRAHGFHTFLMKKENILDIFEDSIGYMVNVNNNFK